MPSETENQETLSYLKTFQKQTATQHVLSMLDLGKLMSLK